MKERFCFAVLAAIAIGALTMSLVSLNRATQADLRADDAHERARLLEEDNRKLPGELMHLKLLRLAAIVGNSVNLTGKDDFEKAISIRNFIHQHVPSKVPAESFDFMEIDTRFAKAMRNDETGHACGGLAILYLAALESQGIPARYVGIYSADREPYASHATVEFWFDGNWIASDPSTNLMFTENGAYLSYADLFRLVQEGKAFNATTNGHAALPERRMENYPPVQSGFMKYMVIHPCAVSLGKETQRKPGEIQTASFERNSAPRPYRAASASRQSNVTRIPMQLFPASWDGAITFLDGKRRDVSVNCGIYSYLANGPLR